jgi:hypothetical protein
MLFTLLLLWLFRPVSPQEKAASSAMDAKRDEVGGVASQSPL